MEQERAGLLADLEDAKRRRDALTERLEQLERQRAGLWERVESEQIRIHQKNGKKRIPFVFDAAQSSSGGIAAVKYDGRWGILSLPE